MNEKRIIYGALVGAFFTALAAVLCFIAAAYLTSNSDKILTTLTLLSIAYIVIYAVVTGGIAGVVISSLCQPILVSILIGFLLNLIFGLILLFLTGGGWNDAMTNAYYISVVIGAINGAVVSFTSLWQSSLE